MKKLLVLLLILAFSLSSCSPPSATQNDDKPTIPETVTNPPTTAGQIVPQTIPETSAPTKSEEQMAYPTVGEGDNTFVFEVKLKDGTIKGYNVKTSKTLVGDALLDAGLIEGDTGDYGLMVTTVDGVKADYSIDQSYWAFHINGGYSVIGVSSAVVDTQNIYSFVYTTEQKTNRPRTVHFCYSRLAYVCVENCNASLAECSYTCIVYCINNSCI